MSTNYYHVTNKACPHCGQVTGTEETHIGKTAAGWPFQFFSPDETVHSFDDWVKRLSRGGQIVSEYGAVIPLSAFLGFVIYGQGKATQTPALRDGVDWQDDEGYYFSDREFS